MSIDQDRLIAVLRIAAVLKNNIIANNNIYDPMLAPNFQSIFDVAVGLSDEEFLQHVTEEGLLEMEQWRLPYFARPLI